MPPVRRRVGWVGDGEDDVHLVPGVSCSRNPLHVRQVLQDGTYPFVTGKTDLVTRDCRNSVAKVGGIRRGD